MKEVDKIVDAYVRQDKIVKVFVASDGKECKTKDECLAYEEKMRIESKITTFSPGELSIEMPWEFYYAGSEEQLLYILKKVGYNNTHYNRYINDKYDAWKDGVKCNENSFGVGDWIGNYIDDSGDCRGTNYIYTLQYVVDKHKKFLNACKEALA